jgi:hypothetical protein
VHRGTRLVPNCTFFNFQMVGAALPAQSTRELGAFPSSLAIELRYPISHSTLCQGLATTTLVANVANAFAYRKLQDWSSIWCFGLSFWRSWPSSREKSSCSTGGLLSCEKVAAASTNAWARQTEDFVRKFDSSGYSSGSPNVKTACPLAMETNCFPSTTHVIGEDVT